MDANAPTKPDDARRATSANLRTALVLRVDRGRVLRRHHRDQVHGRADDRHRRDGRRRAACSSSSPSAGTCANERASEHAQASAPATARGERRRAPTRRPTGRCSSSSASSWSRCSASATRWCRSTRRSARSPGCATSRAPTRSRTRRSTLARTVRIEFDSNVRKLPWTFRPLQPIVDVHPGEVRQVMFEIVNTTDRRADRPGDPELRPAARGAVFPQARVLLLREADAAAGRAPADAGGVRRRSRRCRRTSRRSRCRTRSSRSRAAPAAGADEVRRARRAAGARGREGQARQRGVTDERSTTGAKPYYFVPQPSHWPITGSLALLLMGSGAAFWLNSVAAGPWMVLAGFCVLLVHAVRLVRHRDRRVRGPPLQQEGRPLVPLEHELVHLLRGDVLRRVLRRAVLHPQPVGAGPRQPRRRSCCGPTTRRRGRPSARTSRSSSRRWARSASRCSTRSSCSPRASR